MIISFEAAALEEYRNAAQYSEDRFGLGRKFVEAVKSALEEVGRNPER